MAEQIPAFEPGDKVMTFVGGVPRVFTVTADGGFAPDFLTGGDRAAIEAADDALADHIDAQVVGRLVENHAFDGHPAKHTITGEIASDVRWSVLDRVSQSREDAMSAERPAALPTPSSVRGPLLHEELNRRVDAIVRLVELNDGRMDRWSVINTASAQLGLNWSAVEDLSEYAIGLNLLATDPGKKHFTLPTNKDTDA